MGDNKKLVAVRFNSVATCDEPLSKDVSELLFLHTIEVHEHFVKSLNAVLGLKTDELDASLKKRLFLFYGQLMNDVTGAACTLASHGIRLPQMHLMRSAFEYTARAMYFSVNLDKTLAHFKDLWNKGQRLNKNTNIDPNIRTHIDDQVLKFMEKNPDWKRPHDIGLKDIFISLYGAAKGVRLYERYYVFMSPAVHGTIDGLPNVIVYADGATRVKPFPDIANSTLLTMSRLLFKFTTLIRVTFGITDTETIGLFRRYVRIEKSMGYIRNPFPEPLKRKA